MITAVLLAAGHGERFGGHKLLAPVGGVAMAVRVARTLAGVVDQIVAPVRPSDLALASLLRAEGVDTVACPEAAGGMGFSIACGVRASPAARGWLIVPGDMPFIAQATLTRLRQELDAGAALVAPTHGGRRGHPVGFAARFGAALVALTGDIGARGVLAGHARELVTIPCDDPGILQDVDCPDDLGTC